MKYKIMDFYNKRLIVFIYKGISKILSTIGTKHPWLNKLIVNIPFVGKIVRKRWERQIENAISNIKVKTVDGFEISYALTVSLG